MTVSFIQNGSLGPNDEAFTRSVETEPILALQVSQTIVNIVDGTLKPYLGQEKVL
jgi:hypothetical protein